MNEMPMKVLIAGGGVAGLETVLALRDLAEERVTVDVLADGREFVYRPLSVAEPFEAGSVLRFDLAALLEAADARLRPGTLHAVNPSRRTVQTGDGDVLEYDALVVAVGARAEPAVPGAVTFTGADSVPALRRVLSDAIAGAVGGIVFAAPARLGWPLPLYELGLLTAARLEAEGATVPLAIVTPETAPLAVFGQAASTAVAARLAERGIVVHAETYPTEFDGDMLRVIPGDPIPAGRVVAMPRAVGPALGGLPHDDEGFIPVDPHGRVPGMEQVYAAGDVTSFPVKQGGLATQQADAVAGAIAAAVGAPVRPEPFAPVLRGLVLTGKTPLYLRAEVTRPSARASVVDAEPLWWPPAKIAGRYLAGFLAERAELSFTR